MLTQTNFPSPSQYENLRNIEGPTIIDPPKNGIYSKTSKTSILKLCYDILRYLFSRILSAYPTGNPCVVGNLENRNI